MKTKCLAFGIILLFIGIAYSPIVSAYDDSRASKIFSIPTKDEPVTITVLEYKPDGTIGKSIVKMSREQADEFQKETTDAKDFDKRLSIYKKYNLISQDVTSETLQAGLEENARRLGYTQQKLEEIALNYRSVFLNYRSGGILQDFKIYINMFCKIEGWFATPFILLPIGPIFFNVYILRRFGDLFKIFGLRNRIITEASYVKATNGLLPDFETEIQFSFTKIIGFIGYFYYVNAYWPFAYCLGSALYFRTFGLEV